MKISEIDDTNITNEIIYHILFNVPKREYDYASVLIIFGCHIKELLDERLNCALSVLKEKKIDNIILSGGIGVHGNFNESEYMLSFLKSNGVNTNIILENKSSTSLENAMNCIDILKERSLLDKDIVLVTNEFHMRKVAMMLKSFSEIHLSLIYEYPAESIYTYDVVISNPKIRSVMESQVRKIKRLAIDGKINDEDVLEFSQIKRI